MRKLNVLLLFAAVLPVTAADKPLAFGTVRFEENRGQTDARVRFLARARGQQVFLTDSGVVFSPPGGRAVAMEFPGAGKCQWVAAGPASDSISYYLGNDPSKWIKMAPVFDRVVWHNAWPGIDIAFRGEGDRLEYDLILAPRADPSRIRIRFDRPAKSRVAGDGAVEIASEGNVIRQRVPEIWQETPGVGRHRIDGRFLADGRNGLRVALSGYERSRTVVVDPVLEMATYLGGENDDEIVAITDGAVAGNTRSIAFPLNNPALRSSRDIFIRGTSPLSSVSSRNSYSGTLVIGGSGDDQLAGIAVTTLPYFGFYVAGTTTSTDFPIVSYSSKYHGGASDGFVAYIGVSGYTGLSGSFYVGGSGEDRINCFTGDGTFFALAGATDSPDLPAVNAPQQTLAGGKDAFYGVLAPFFGGTAVYGYIGGSGDDAAYAVSLRYSGSLWIGGQTSSQDFRAAGSLAGPSDAFLAEVSTTTAFNYPNAPITVKAWRIGGSGDDSIRALVATRTSSTYVNGAYLSTPFVVDGIAFAGVTTSPDFPVLNAAQSQPGGDKDGFVGVWDTTASAPRWLTYLGGSGPDEANAIARTWSGDLYVGGSTGSTDLPVVNALQPNPAGGQDGMFAAYDALGALQHLTYFGGSGDDRIEGIAVASNSDARVVGSTTSTDLPQRQAWQDRGGAMDGFVADIGSDFFLGPTSLILAKDGSLTFSIGPARTAFRVPVTYRSSDPSLIRLVYLGRSFDQVTAAPEEYMAVEGLADSGQADILVSSPGFNPKTIHVTLYPGAFVWSQSSSPVVSTWATSSNQYASYCAVDPATNAVVGVCMGVRSGAPAPVMHWTSSDPTVINLSDNGYGGAQLQVLQAGNATITLTVDGYTVLQGTQTLSAVAPRPAAPVSDFHLGRDLTAVLPISFTLNGRMVTSGYQGTLTARSGDPSRLLLSLDGSQPGTGQVSVAMSGRSPTIVAQALADDGPVQVYLSMAGVDGEVPMTVVLEPSELHWGVQQSGPSGYFFSTSPSLTTGTQSTPLMVWLQGTSGGVGQLRPGAGPTTLTLSNSDPTVLELNRLTSTMGDNTKYSLRGIAAGSSTLTLASSNPAIQPVPATLPVTVQTAVAALPTFSPTYYVGSGLQTQVTFRYDTINPANLTVAVDDASIALVSSSTGARGSDHLVLSAGSPVSDYFSFYVQGLRSSGNTTVHVRFPEGEQTFTVNLLPSAAGFNTRTTGASVQGFNQEASVAAYALDPTTGIGVFQQTPMPGPGIAVHFSADGSVRLNKNSGVLTADLTAIPLDYTLPPAGQQATLTVTTDSNPSVSPITATLKVGSAVSTDPTILASIVLSRGELGQVSLKNVSLPATVTSSDPQNVLVSATATDAGTASVQLPNGASTLFVHALGSSGSFTLKLEPDAASSVIQVGLHPLQFSIYSYSGGTLAPGGTVDFQATLNATKLRPGVGPFHFTAQTADTSIATVSPAAFDVGGGATFAGKLTVAGVSHGTTHLMVTGPPDVYIVPPDTEIDVHAASPATAPPAFALGVNLQGSTQIDMGANFSNPNGAIVTLSSSNPAVMLLSRSATTVGSASVVVAVPAGARLTQAVYLQALAQGNVTLQATVNGSTQAVATVGITGSWVSCGAKPVSMNVGDTQTLYCFAQFNAPQVSPYRMAEVGPRAGLTDITLNLSSSSPDVFAVTPSSMTLAAASSGITLRGVSAGSAVLKLSAPAAFGPSPDGSEAVTVTVTPPPLTTNCSPEIVLGKDTQVTCNIGPAAATVTATSGDPSLLVLSADPNAAGGVTASGQNVSLTLQALAAYGTVEVLITAPGYRDLRIAVALRPSEINLATPPYQSTPLSMHVGNTSTLTVSMRSGSYPSTPRAGANVAVDLVADQAGIISLTPAHLVFSGPQSSGTVQVKAVAAGSTLLRMNVPAGYAATGTPLAISVTP
jgi:hypothetical protein